MTARTRKGFGHHATHGADHGKQHERLGHAHTSGSRPEGAPMSSQSAPMAPPMAPSPDAAGAAPPMTGAPGGDSEPDTEMGDQS